MNDDQLENCIDNPAARSEVSAVELTQAFLRRVSTWQPKINAFILVTEDMALADARRIDQQRARGIRLPLDGMPIALKDNIDVADTRTTVGSRLFEHNVAKADATVVRRLRDAGAVILGKLNLHELCYGATSKNQTFGAVRNPWEFSRIPGGSSGGSGAAIGADLAIGSLGSDTGGSIRVPSALNGVSGLRPTHGSVSNVGTYPLSWSFDTIGPLARSVEDVFRIWRAIVGFDPADPRADQPHDFTATSFLNGRLDGVRIGLPRSYFFEEIENDVAHGVAKAARVFESTGAKLVDIDVAGASEAWRACNLILRAEALAINGERFRQSPELIGDEVAERLRLGADISGTKLAALYQEMYDWRRKMRDLFREVDLVLTPTTNQVAPLIDGSNTVTSTATLSRFTYPWSLAAQPALAIPCALSSANLPIGVQLVARPWEEPLLNQAGDVFQHVTDWHRRRPPKPMI